MKLINLSAALIAVFLAGCNYEVSTDQTQRVQQEQLSKQGQQQVGMPAITNFAEKRMMKDILELRDQNVATITYIVDLNNHMKKLCNSIGFGLPYATQYTNPQRIAEHPREHGVVVLPQADPNGLFSPAAAEGTWILCVSPETKKAVPLYVEPRVIISPFALD